MPLRKSVKMSDELYEKISKVAEEKNLTFQDTMDRIFNHYASQGKLNDRIEVLERENAQLKCQSPQNVGASQLSVEPSPMGQHRLESTEALPPNEVVAQETRHAEDAPAPHSDGRADAGPLQAHIMTPNSAITTPPIPFEASPTSPQASTNTSNSSTNGSTAIMESCQSRKSDAEPWQRYRNDYWQEQQQFRFGVKKEQLAELFKMKEEHTQRIEDIKAEGARQRNFRDARKRPVQDNISPPFTCPKGHSRNDCYNSLCESHGQCLRDGNIQPLQRRDNGSPVDASIPYVS